MRGQDEGFSILRGGRRRVEGSPKEEGLEFQLGEFREAFCSSILLKLYGSIGV